LELFISFRSSWVEYLLIISPVKRSGSFLGILLSSRDWALLSERYLGEAYEAQHQRFLLPYLLAVLFVVVFVSVYWFWVRTGSG